MGIIKIVFITVAIAVGTVVSIFVPKHKHDSAAEEVTEHIIHIMTGVDVDLTPNSPEPDIIETDTNMYPFFEDWWDSYFDEDGTSLDTVLPEEEWEQIQETVAREHDFPVEKILYT